MIENLMVIGATSLVWLVIISVLYYIGAKPEEQKEVEWPRPEPKPPTKTSIYADHVLNAASRIYCNYNESKIIRIGGEQAKKDRYAAALTEAFNLVNKAYAVFDELDREQAGTRKPVSKKSNNDIDFNIN